MFGNFSLFKTPFPGWNSVPPSFVSFFCLLYFFLPPFEYLGCFSGCLMSSAGIQKLFCGIYLAFKCSFDEFVGEKVFSPSYSSAILAPPPNFKHFTTSHLSNSLSLDICLLLSFCYLNNIVINFSDISPYVKIFPKMYV